MHPAIIFSMIGVLLQGCASVPSQNMLQLTAQKLIGKSQADLLQCAGQPISQSSYEHAKVLRYYKEASIFEESWPCSKGSFPGDHHGCWARVLIEKDQVVGIEFQAVPEAADRHCSECKDIFQACSP